MLGIRTRSNLKRKVTSPTKGSSQKRRLTSPYSFENSASDQSPSPRKIVRSDEECSPTFSATSFYSPKAKGGYQTPAERQQRRAELGEVLPTKPPVETKTTQPKTKKRQGPLKAGHATQRTGRSTGKKPTLKSKTQTKKEIKTQPKRVETTPNKKSSPSKKTINKSPKKKSPKKRSPSKRTPRKSPRKGVKKAVKLYLQGLKKTTKPSKGVSGRKTSKKNASVKPAVEMTEKRSPRPVSKKLDLQDESQSDGGAAQRLDAQDELLINAPSPQSAKKRAMRSKEECLDDVRRSPRKAVKLSQKMAEDDEEVPEDRDQDGELNFLQGFDPDTPDSLTPPVPQAALPKKAQVTTLAAAITPPLSPSNVKLISSSRKSPASSTPIQQKKAATKMKKLIDKDGLEQLTLDLGQKHFGAVTCGMCGMVYTAAHPEDEAVHDRFHRKYLNCIKFQGWKNERMLREFYDGRIIMVLYDDPKYHIKKVEEIRQLVDQELGFLEGDEVACKSSCKVLLFITREKKVAGCLIAQEISKGYRVIADKPKDTAAVSEEEKQQFEQQRAWCCQTDPEPAVCGISRIWVASQERRKQIATRMLDCVRNSFTFGTTLPKSTLAFSDPTPDGKMLATSYVGSPEFLVYKYH
ncbi:uncharacterized protein [Asterias amurensis]|uniref:uncharacterized protein n=1 Tax=Asterias amurensis TaxID=7602 RepID=UPI003AB7EB85